MNADTTAAGMGEPVPGAGQHHIPDRADARANRLRIIEAARAIFSEQGLDVEMRDIADRSGLGVGTLYRNFASKEDLVSAIVAGLLSEAILLVEGAAALADARASVEEFLVCSWEIADRNGDIVTILRRKSDSAPAEAAALTALVTRIVVRAVEDRVLRADVPVVFIVALLMALFDVYLDTRVELGSDAARRACSDAFRRAAFAAPAP